MDLTDRKRNLFEALKEIAKSTLTYYIPVIGPAIDGYNAYKESVFKRQVDKMLKYLNEKVETVENLKNLFSDEWLNTEEGRQFTNKVFDCIFDAQIEEKQELFINALINGITKKDLLDVAKLKFVDILRNLSLASLNILADIHNIYKTRQDHESSISSSGLINKDELVKKLSNKYHPYLIESCFYELKGVGLFSPTVGYTKTHNGKYIVRGYHAEGNELYTEFTQKFIEFILFEKLPFWG
jgi:hypothetical protein